MLLNFGKCTCLHTGAIVRPHLENCIQAWIPYSKNDIDTLEIIQRRTTKIIPALRYFSYEESLKEGNIYALRNTEESN